MTKIVDVFCFFSFWVFFHEHSLFTGQQAKGGDIFVTPLYHFHPLHTQTLARRLLQRAHLCTQLAAGLEPGNFGFLAQVANDIVDIGNLVDLLRTVIIHEECGNLKVFVDSEEFTRNIYKKKKPGVFQAYRCPLCDKFYRREYFFNKHLKYCESVR